MPCTVCQCYVGFNRRACRFHDLIIIVRVCVGCENGSATKCWYTQSGSQCTERKTAEMVVWKHEPSSGESGEPGDQTRFVVCVKLFSWFASVNICCKRLLEILTLQKFLLIECLWGSLRFWWVSRSSSNQCLCCRNSDRSVWTMYSLLYSIYIPLQSQSFRLYF